MKIRVRLGDKVYLHWLRCTYRSLTLSGLGSIVAIIGGVDD